MRHVVEEGSHSDVKLIAENKIFHGLISALFRWDGVVLWKFDWVWVTPGHENSEGPVTTIVTVLDGQ